MFGNKFTSLQILRSIFAIALVAFICRTTDLGTPMPLVALATVSGILVTGYWVRKPKGLWRCIKIHAAVATLIGLIFWLADPLVGAFANGSADADFVVARLWHHVSLLGFCYGLTLVGSWLFWCWRHTVTIEIITISALFIWLTSGHRNYHLDAPKKLSDLAWDLNFAPQIFLLTLGATFTIAAGIYLALSSARPLFGRRPNPITTVGPRQKFLSASIPLLLLCILGLLATYINQHYSQNLSRATNGVGQQDRQGQSPLGFHSAIGNTKQPAALVRLDTDYTENPWEPMLYFREGALSEYNGRELVIASDTYDTDVPRLLPGQAYSRKDWTLHGGRKQIAQSVYLLTDHKAPFAIDYPLSFRLIKNPDPERFKLSYQVLSAAPVAQVPQLFGEAVGDASWTKTEWDHYTRAPGSLSIDEPAADVASSNQPVLDKNGEDLRYRAMAHEIAKGGTTPIEKAALISQYLSENSIYTRNPGHEATDKGDPVAPYLFAEKKRGYCVHFAHAAVYLMRLLGIPSRIATGYLTDLRYAKDGHILLNLGDRHAWPEVYVEGQGWAIVDIQPAAAENERELVPDEKLLEELMNKINPAEEFVPPAPPQEDQTTSVTEKIISKALSRRTLGTTAICALLLYLLTKYWLRYGYRLARNDESRLKRAYLSFAATMCDSGLLRSPGETRSEYQQRLSAGHQIRAEQLTNAYERVTYCAPTSAEQTFSSQALAEWHTSYVARFSKTKRIAAFLNPSSLFKRWEL